MTLIHIRHCGGEVYVNPDHIVSVEPDDPAGATKIATTGGRVVNVPLPIAQVARILTLPVEAAPLPPPNRRPLS